MPRQNIYRDVQASLIRFCRDFGDLHDLAFVNLDASTNAENWPETDFIGIGELHVDVQETDEVTVSFGLSTRDDPHLLRLAELVNRLVNELLPGTPLMLYNAETGIIESAMNVANGVRIAPPMETKTQPLQPVMVRFLGTNRNL